MKIIRLATLSLFSAFAALLALVVTAAPVQAQATRTWVSGVGDDVNPCSRTAPCKTFAGAISKTAAGGEINCIDQGAYGTVTITKSITIDCTATFAGILSSATTGVIVNGAGIDVTLRSLDINGGTPSAAGLIGVRFLQGASLTIENSKIFNFMGAAPNGWGIRFEPSTAARLYVANSTINRNGSATSGGGILIDPTAAAGVVNVILEDVRIQNNGSDPAGAAVKIDTTGPSSVVAAIIDNVQMTGTGNGLLVNAPAGGGGTGIAVSNSIIEQNSGAGISAVGPLAAVRVGSSHITGNGTGVLTSGGGVISSYGDNMLDSNGANGTFTGAVLPRK